MVYNIILLVVVIYVLVFNITTYSVIKLLSKRIDILEESLKEECEFIDTIHKESKNLVLSNTEFLTSLMERLGIEQKDEK